MKSKTLASTVIFKTRLVVNSVKVKRAIKQLNKALAGTVLEITMKKAAKQ